MAEVKWIKVVTDIFEDEKMLLIDSMQKRDSIEVIWFKLLCLAGKQNNGGVFMMNGEGFSIEMFSNIFRRPKKLVELAFKEFERLGMIKVYNNVATIPNWEKYQKLDAYEKKRLRDKEYQKLRRQKQKELIDNKSQCDKRENDDSSSINRPTNDDCSLPVAPLDKDKDIDIKELSSNEDNEKVPQAEAEQSNCPYSKIKDLYNAICVSLPQIKTIDGTRKNAVSARWRTYKNLDTFSELFTLAEASAFLKGDNARNWHADFDWLMKATNMAKVLENKYENQKSPLSEQLNKSYDLDEFWQAALNASSRETFGGE